LEEDLVVKLAAGKVGRQGGIFILMDSDKERPVILAQELLKRAQAARSDIPLAVVVAKCEYEAWFLAAATSLRGKRGFSPDLTPPPKPEGVRDAKGWLQRNMSRGRKYSETLDQAALTQLFALQAAQSARSFRKCHKEITNLLVRLRDEL